MSQPPDGTTPSIAPGDHAGYMRFALTLARESPPKPTNFCVGAVLVDEPNNRVLSTGYTLELPGNTHAEQCCFLKFAAEHNLTEEELGSILPKGTGLYTTMEPCGKRSVGNMPCVDRILRTKESPNGGIKTVYLGVTEPETFVGENVGRAKLEANGIRCVHVPGFEEEILKVATAGHQNKGTASNSLSEIERLHHEVTDSGKPISRDLKTRYAMKGIHKEQTFSNKWDGKLPDNSFTKTFRQLDSVTVPKIVSVPKTDEEDAKKGNQ